MGRRVIAIDTETVLMSYPDQVNPDGVCVSIAEGQTVQLRRLEPGITFTLLRTLLLDPEVTLVGHNIAFDLHVIRKACPRLESAIYTALDENRIEDTMLRERLYLIGTEGRSDARPCSLAALAERWCGIKLEGKDGDAWRYRYAELMDTPIYEWPAGAKEYAELDAVTTLKVRQAQESARKDTGPGSMNTQHLQVKAAYALRQLTIDGIRVDTQAVQYLSDVMADRYDQCVEYLKSIGLVRPSGTRDMAAIRGLLKELGVTETTATGAVSTSRRVIDTLAEEYPQDDRVQALAVYSKLQKGVNTFIPQLSFERLHPEYNPIVSTLRTSCRASDYYKHGGKMHGKKVIKRGDPYPSVNFQQIPRDEAYRRCFVPEEGHVFVCADYSNLELVCAAQRYYETFGFSDMREVLNSGVNLHDDMVAYHKGLPLEEVVDRLSKGDKELKAFRNEAKTITLGIPGGRGAKGIARGCGMGESHALYLYERLMSRFAEMAKFFGEHPGDRGYIGEHQDGIKWYDGDPVQMFSGAGPSDVWLAQKTFCQFANCWAMQMPGALGAKAALYRLVRECRIGELQGCETKALVHDEFVVSVPREQAQHYRQRVCDIMCVEMQRVATPDMAVGCEAALQVHWDKGPNGGYDEIQHIQPLATNVEKLGQGGR